MRTHAASRVALPQAAFERVRFVGPVAPQREALERFIAQRYAEAFGASLRRFMPWLAAFEGGDGELHAALGLRGADHGPLFVERYLDAPIEQALRGVYGQGVARGSVIEVGNFAARHAGDTRRMIRALVERLVNSDYRYVVFVATLGLRNAFGRLGLAPRAVAAADPARLGAERGDWGSYYDGDPQVVVGDLASGLAWLRERDAATPAGAAARVVVGDCTACA